MLRGREERTIGAEETISMGVATSLSLPGPGTLSFEKERSVMREGLGLKKKDDDSRDVDGE